VAADGQQEQKVGAKVTCATCGTTVVIVKAPTAPIECCGAPIGSSAETTSKETAGG
jgi:hypothetical protein